MRAPEFNQIIREAAEEEGEGKESYQHRMSRILDEDFRRRNGMTARRSVLRQIIGDDLTGQRYRPRCARDVPHLYLNQRDHEGIS